MPNGDRSLLGGQAAGAGVDEMRRTVERRRPTVARLRFQPDPRRLRALLNEVDTCLGSRDPLLRRNVRLVVGEIVARLLDHCPEATVDLDLEIKADSARIDIAVREGECDFWDALDDAVFTDLTTEWGRDRRGGGGAWFEIAAPIAANPRREPR